jgi:type I restriction enzyme S subunit
MTLRVSADEIVVADTSGLLGIHQTWSRVRLGEVARVQNGFAFKSALFSKDTGTPLLRIRDVGSNSPDTFIDAEVDPAYVVQRGDIVIGMDGDFRAARWDGPPAALNQRVCRLIPTSEGYDGRFLYYTLQPYLDAVNRATSAVTVKHLSSTTVADLPLPLPPLAEQGRIVSAIDEAFSKLGAGDTGLRTVRQLLKRMRDAILDAAVAGRLVPQRPGDRPAGELLAELGVDVSPPLEPLPSGWCRARLGDLVGREGLFVDGDWVETKDQDPLGEVRLTQLADIGVGQWRNRSNRFMSTAASERLGCTLLQEGDVLVARMPEPLGRACQFPGDVRPCVTVVDVAILRPDPRSVSPIWLMWAINSRVSRGQIEALKAGTTRKRISRKNLASVTFSVPPVEEQQRIANEIDRQLSFLDACERAVDAGLARAVALRRSVLQAAFEGRLVPQDPADGPASALLERIRAERAAAPKARRAGAKA